MFGSGSPEVIKCGGPEVLRDRGFELLGELNYELQKCWGQIYLVTLKLIILAPAFLQPVQKCPCRKSPEHARLPDFRTSGHDEFRTSYS
jgi:hypothetical protein